MALGADHSTTPTRRSFSYPILVLHVEDNPADAVIAQELVRPSRRFFLTRVDNVHAAIDRLHHDEFDVVLLDLNLADSHGLTTVATIRAEFPDLPIVVMSGFGTGDPWFVSEAKQDGAQAYLTKSQTTPEMLEQALLAAVRGG